MGTAAEQRARKIETKYTKEPLKLSQQALVTSSKYFHNIFYLRKQIITSIDNIFRYIVCLNTM